MPVTFGAVGDIISVVLLVKDLVGALDDARGSKAEYQAAVRELWVLDRTLLEIDLLTRQHGGGATPELRGLCETAKQAVARCNDRISTYKKRIDGYKSSFDPGHKVNRLREAGRAIAWRIGEKEALEQFRAEIAGTTSSLQMLLITANTTLLGLSRKEMNDKLDEAKIRNDVVNFSHDAALIAIKDGIQNANHKIEAGNSVLGNLSETLKLDWVRQLGSELKSLMRGAMAINFATYRAVIRLQNALPSHLERGMFEEPIILDDPIGRISPVHLQFITSWDAFHSVLEVRFENAPGYRKMIQRKYSLELKGTKKDISQSRLWQDAFLPGQRVEMSFIFNDKGSGDTCPGCQTTSDKSVDADTHCENCQIWFRRIQEVPQEPFGERDGMQHREHTARSSRSESGKRTLDDLGEYEEDITKFKRVRLSKQKPRFHRMRFHLRRPESTRLVARMNTDSWGLHFGRAAALTDQTEQAHFPAHSPGHELNINQAGIKTTDDEKNQDNKIWSTTFLANLQNELLHIGPSLEDLLNAARLT